MRRFHPVVSAFLVSFAIVGAAAAVLFSFRGWQATQFTFMRLRIVNDTTQTVKVQPCWDLACQNTIGLHEAVLASGASRFVPGEWTNSEPEEITVGVSKPGAEAMHYEGCVIRAFEAGVKVGVFRVSQQGPCPQFDPGAGAGG